MVWRFFPHKHPTEFIKNAIYGAYWWTDSIKHIEIQITPTMLKLIEQDWKDALKFERPLTLVEAVGLNSKWRKITDLRKGDQMYLVAYAKDNLYSIYDPGKISSIKTNSVNLYFEWDPTPQSLKDFILNKDHESEVQTILNTGNSNNNHG